jgi:hypothetical protein
MFLNPQPAYSARESLLRCTKRSLPEGGLVLKGLSSHYAALPWHFLYFAAAMAWHKRRPSNREVRKGQNRTGTGRPSGIRKPL